MLQLKEAEQTDVGFVDSDLIFKDIHTKIEHWVPETENNLFRFFDAYLNKEIVLFPYGFPSVC
jgi:hypothetical protein